MLRLTTLAHWLLYYFTSTMFVTKLHTHFLTFVLPTSKVIAVIFEYVYFFMTVQKNRKLTRTGSREYQTKTDGFPMFLWTSNCLLLWKEKNDRDGYIQVNTVSRVGYRCTRLGWVQGFGSHFVNQKL